MPRNTSVPRILHGDKVRTMGAALAIDYSTVRDRLGGALDRAFGSHKSSAKRLALVIDGNERTAANLLAKRNLPDALNMLLLMREVPEFAAEVMRITGLQADLDPEFDKEFMSLMTRYQRMRDQGRGVP